MREITGGKDVWHLCTAAATDSTTFGQMRFDKSAVPAREFAERMECFDHPGALGPPAAGARGERHHGNFAPGERLLAEFPPLLLFARRVRFERSENCDIRRRN